MLLTAKNLGGGETTASFQAFFGGRCWSAQARMAAPLSQFAAMEALYAPRLRQCFIPGQISAKP